MRNYIFDKKEKGVFDLIKNCASTDHTREFLTHVYYNGESLVATDGKRLVKVTSKKIVENLGEDLGYFNVTGNAIIEVVCNQEYCNYKRVIPADSGTAFYVPVNTKTKKYNSEIFYAAICIYTGRVFNPELLEGCSEVGFNNIYTNNISGLVKLSKKTNDYDVVFVALPYIDKSFLENKVETLEKTA